MERVTADGSADLFLFSAESRDIRHHFFFFEGMKCRFILLRHGSNLQFRYRDLGIELLQAGIRIGIGKSLPQFRKLSFVLLRVPRQRSLAVRHTLQQFPAVSHAQLFPDLLCCQVFCSQRCYCNSCLRQDRQQKIHIAPRLTEIQIGQLLLSCHPGQLPFFLRLIQHRCQDQFFSGTGQCHVKHTQFLRQIVLLHFR